MGRALGSYFLGGRFGYFLFFWRAGTTPILKKTLREFGLKFRRPRVAPRVAPRIGFSHKLGRECHSENCSENAPEVRELLREWPFHSESVFFKIGVVPRFLNFCSARGRGRESSRCREGGGSVFIENPRRGVFRGGGG